MSLTREIIETSSDHLDEVAKLIIISLIRECDIYKSYANILVSKIQPAIDAAEGTLKARQLNGILKEIEKLGIGEVEIQDTRDGVRWSQSKERYELVKQLLFTLLDVASLIGSGSDSVVVRARQNYGVAATRQRLTGCNCLSWSNTCSCR